MGGAMAVPGASTSVLTLTPVDLHLVDQEVAERVIPPPADALTAAQREELVAEEPLSLLHVLGPEGDDDETAGRTAGDRIRELVAAGRYHHRGPCFAVHELTTDGHRQRGLVAGIPIEDARAGRVLAHEQTRQDRERRLAGFLDAAGMDVSPVLLTHPAIAALTTLVDEVAAGEPDLAFTGWHGVHHRVWLIGDVARQERVAAAAEAIEALTIVDGHHRVAAALSSGTTDTLLAELIPDDQLRMVGFDRRVVLEDPEVPGQVIDGLADVADVESLGDEVPDRPLGSAEVLVGITTGWYRAEFREVPETLPDRLPAALLQERVLGPLVGITDPRTDPRLEYVPGLGDLAGLHRSLWPAPALAFVPRAITVTELLEIAAAGATLPPKSTYVDPKPGPGVLLRLRDRQVVADP